MPVLIVSRPLMRVGQHLAGLLRLLEGLLRVPIVGIAIGMIFHGQTAIGLLDLRLGRPLRYVEYLVVVALRHGPSLRGLASLVFDLLEFRVHHVIGPRTAAARRAAGTRAGLPRGACRTLAAARVGALRDSGRSLGKGLGLLVD